MIQDSTFKVESIEIKLARGERALITLQFSPVEEYPISGFPQALIIEDRSSKFLVPPAKKSWR